MRLCYIFLVAFLMLFASCSNKISEKEVILSESEVIAEINQLHSDGFITQQNASDAIANIVSFEQKGFVGQYWWVILFVFLSFILILTVVLVAYKDEDELSDPMKKSKAYWVVGGLGFLGGHYIYVKKYSWIAVFTIFITILFFFWNYSYIMYFYDIPSVLFIPNLNCIYYEELGVFYCWQVVLFTLYFINLLMGLVFTPFWVYQFNGNYFRKHKDNDAILNGKSLAVDYFYNSKLIPHINAVKDDEKYVKNVIKDDSYTIEEDGDENISGFFKNIFTLGKSSKLKNKIQRLRALQSCCELLQTDLDTLDAYNEELYSYLGYYRVAAYRNLYLAKELIRVVKDNVSSQQQELIKDEFPNLVKPENNVSVNMQFDSSQISFDSERFFDTLGSSFTRSFDSISKKLDGEKEISKQDFLSAGIEFAFDSVIAGIEGVLDQYQRVSASLREVEMQINEAVMYLHKVSPVVLRYIAEMYRQSEIMIALSQCNRAFIMAYEPMRQKVFGRPTFSQFLHGINKDQEYFKSEEIRKDIHHLISVCSEYNKVYKTKTGMDTNKMKEPSVHSTPAKSQVKPMVEENATKALCPSEEIVVKSRESVLATIKRLLNNKYINEGNTLAFLDLPKDGTVIEHLCQELSIIAGKNISRKDVFKCKNIKEVIDLVIK